MKNYQKSSKSSIKVQNLRARSRAQRKMPKNVARLVTVLQVTTYFSLPECAQPLRPPMDDVGRERRFPSCSREAYCLCEHKETAFAAKNDGSRPTSPIAEAAFAATALVPSQNSRQGCDRRGQYSTVTRNMRSLRRRLAWHFRLWLRQP